MTSEKSPYAIAVHHNGRVVLVRLEEIDWISASSNYATLHCGSETHLIRATMIELESRLDCRFLRIHRSTIVNFDRIRELQAWFRGEYRVVLKDGTELALTRTYREGLESRLLIGSRLFGSARRRGTGIGS